MVPCACQLKKQISENLWIRGTTHWDSIFCGISDPLQFKIAQNFLVY